ncbi:MAG: DNA repair protein RecO [Bacteroidetes bacterium]|nr:DNA repair protein RecO [Bacteroidota bacterium]
MPDKLHKTKGIVLRTVKYGETSVIVTLFTELFGLQAYLVNGVRTSSKKSAGKAALFQPAALLDMVVYHNDLKHLNRIREYKWATVFESVLSDISKNAVALFMVEMLSKSLKAPESQPELFQFTEDCLLELDRNAGTVVANLPLFYALHLSHFLGFRMTDNYNEEYCFLDMAEGSFVNEQPHHPHFLEGNQALVTSQILKAQQPSDLDEIKLNHDFRRRLLHVFETYYALHIHDFGTLKSLPVLREVLG